jgi:hypothetical protein
VVILADGAVMEPQTVSGGSIELPYNVDKAIVGLAYTYKLKPMRFDAQIDGSTKGTVKNIGEVVLSFYQSGNVKYGPDSSNLRTIDWRTTEAYGTPPALFTGDKVVSFEGGFDAEDSILITGSDPLPCTLRAMVLRTDLSGR